jgi:hypothetical protein
LSQGSSWAGELGAAGVTSFILTVLRICISHLLSFLDPPWKSKGGAVRLESGSFYPINSPNSLKVSLFEDILGFSSSGTRTDNPQPQEKL